MMKRVGTVNSAVCGLALLASLPVSEPAEAQDAKAIIATVIERRAERLAGVDNYTLVQVLNGAETTLYFERVEPEGLPLFRIVPPHEYQAEALRKAGLDGGFPMPGLEGAGPTPAALPLPAALSKLPGPAGSGEQGGLAGKAAGVALGAASGGLQEQLTQKGMQGLMKLAAPDAGDPSESGPSREVLERFGRAARIEGTEVVDGARCHILRADGIQGSELARGLAGGEDLELRSLAVWIDAEEYVPRRAVSEAEFTAEGRPQRVTFELLSGDYRVVDGMYEPFRLVMRVSGLMDAMLAADPKKAAKIREQARESMARKEQVEEMLARMPPEQRRMAEAQMAAAFTRVEQFVGGGGEPVEMVTVVKELRVNVGPPTPFGRGQLVVEGAPSLELPEAIARLAPASGGPGRPSAWTIQLMGAMAGAGGGIVQLRVSADLALPGERAGSASGSFRWQDGTRTRVVAPEGDARITVASNDGRRIAGEFAFEATAEIETEAGTQRGRTVVRGRFEVPVTPLGR